MTGGRAQLYRNWVLACTAGELVGFGGIPVAGAAAAIWLTAGFEPPSRSLILYATAVLGGLGEGAVLAWFQLLVLRGCLPGLVPRAWIRATALAAAFAWACGMLAPTLDDVFGLAPATQVTIWLPASVLILLSIGGAQALVLEGIVRRPRGWLFVNVLGWLAGLPWTFVLPALLPAQAPMVQWVSVFVLAGVLMGLTVGLVTGIGVLRLEPLSRGDGRGQSSPGARTPQSR